MTGGDKGSHVEGLTDQSAAAVDVALAAQEAAIAIKGSEARQRGGLVLGQAAEFGQGGEQSSGGSGAHALDLGQSGEFGAQARAVGDDTSQIGVERGDLAIAEGDGGEVGAGHKRVGALETMFFDGAVLDELKAAGVEKGELLESGLERIGGRGLEHLAVGAEQLSIDFIGFGQAALRASEVADLARIDDADGEPGLVTGADQQAFAAAGGLANEVHARG